VGSGRIVSTWIGGCISYPFYFSVFDAPNGYNEVRTKLGLGIEVDEKAVRETSVL